MRVRPRLPLGLVVLAFVLASLALLRADITPADVYLKAADILTRDWRFRDALELYAQAERVGDEAQRLRGGLGVATSSIRIADFDTAYSKASRLLQAYPNDLQAMSVYGQAAWANGMFAEAEQAFRQVLGRHASEPASRLGLARVLAAHNRLDEALDNALAVVGAAPGEAEPYSVAAGIYRRMRQLDQSVLYLTRYYDLLPAWEFDKRSWTQGEIAFLKSFGRRVPGEIAATSLLGVHTVPIRLENDKVILPARINGESIDLVLDTGAEQTVLSERMARRLNIASVSSTISAGVGEIGLRGLQTSRIDTLQIGSLTIRNVPCLVKSPALEGLPVRESDAFSPLGLGLSVVIDYRAKQVMLARTLNPEPQPVEMPLWFSRLATIRGVINGTRPASFIVDTGGEVVSIALDTARALSPQPPGRRIPLQVFGISGWDRDAFLMPGVTLAFDDVSMPNASVVVLNLRAPSILLGYRVGGTLGHRLLSRYRVTIDLQRSVLGLNRQ